jgi:hypothetical protein
MASSSWGPPPTGHNRGAQHNNEPVLLADHLSFDEAESVTAPCFLGGRLRVLRGPFHDMIWLRKEVHGGFSSLKAYPYSRERVLADAQSVRVLASLGRVATKHMR